VEEQGAAVMAQEQKGGGWEKSTTESKGCVWQCLGGGAERRAESKWLAGAGS